MMILPRIHTGRKGFTLAEILIVIGIIGVIVAAGLAPLMYTVRNLGSVRDNFAKDNRERAVFNRMLQDLREVITIHAPVSVKVVHNDAVGESNDLLYLWTRTTTYSTKPLSSVVYGMPQESVLRNDWDQGLYRWVLSKDVQPDKIAFDDLKQELASLILPDVTGVSFAVLNGTSWVDSYTGPMPQALRVTFEYEDEERNATYEGWLPKL